MISDPMGTATIRTIPKRALNREFMDYDNPVYMYFYIYVYNLHTYVRMCIYIYIFIHIQYVQDMQYIRRAIGPKDHKQILIINLPLSGQSLSIQTSDTP